MIKACTDPFPRILFTANIPQLATHKRFSLKYQDEIVSYAAKGKLKTLVKTKRYICYSV
jgi:hypothetical protein